LQFSLDRPFENDFNQQRIPKTKLSLSHGMVFFHLAVSFGSVLPKIEKNKQHHQKQVPKQTSSKAELHDELGHNYKQMRGKKQRKRCSKPLKKPLEKRNRERPSKNQKRSKPVIEKLVLDKLKQAISPCRRKFLVHFHHKRRSGCSFDGGVKLNLIKGGEEEKKKKKKKEKKERKKRTLYVPGDVA
jgi:hypothetical protein